MDAGWWGVYGKDVFEIFQGEKFTLSSIVKNVQRAKIPVTLNSGAGAILLAQQLGASRVTLIGYDGAKQKGKAHWHADHPSGLGNAGASHLWPDQFKKLRANVLIPVVNCSRRTAITAFGTSTIEAELWQTKYSES